MAAAGITLVLIGCIAGAALIFRGWNGDDKDLIKTFLPLPHKLTLRPADMLVSLTLPLPKPSRPDTLDGMRQKLALLEEQFRGAYTQYKKNNGSVPGNAISEIKQKLSILEDQLMNMQASMFPDLLLQKQGGDIRGKIIDESLEKIFIRTSWGPKTPVHRNRIKFVVYAREDEKRFAEILAAGLPAIESKVAKLKNALTAFEEEFESARISSEDEVPSSGDADEEIVEEQPAEAIQSKHVTSLQIPLTEQGWDVLYDCGEEAAHSFIDNTLSISTNNVTEDSGCVITISSIDSIEGIPDTIEMLVQIRREAPSANDHAMLFLTATLVDGMSIEYCLFDSQADRARAEQFQADDRLVIRRPHHLILPDEGWQLLTLPLGGDAANFGDNPKIAKLTLTHRHEGQGAGFFESRCRSITVHMREASPDS